MADILVIEDDKAIQNLLKIALKQENHTVAAVRTAREGIDSVGKNIVDLIVLELGLPAMDGIYVQKPFSTAELMARIRAALRHSAAGAETQASTFTNGRLTIDYAAHSVFLDDAEVHLTNYEYKILCLLAQNVGKTLTHNFIISKVWGAGGNDASGLRVFMAGIRRKIEKDPFLQELIRTDVGVGYRMNKI